MSRESGVGLRPLAEMSEEELKEGSVAKALVSELKSGSLQILTIVEQLGPLLTAPKSEMRASGVQLLTDVIVDLPTNFLAEDQLNFILTFYIERLKDNHRVIPPTLVGILAIINMENFPNSFSAKILKNIFDNIPCQQQVQTDRHNIYSIIFKLFTKCKDDILSMGLDFVLPFVLSIDSERDPRNLMFLFSNLPALLRVINLGHVAEEMFEVIACYFPVDFNTPQNDVNAITRDDLANKLQNCLCSTPSFAEYCIPLLFEKLDSNLKVAKLDSLRLLKECCTVFPPGSFECHLHTMWESLRKEIFQDDAEIKPIALETLSSVVSCLCSNKSTLLLSDSFLKQIITTVQCALSDIKTKLKLEMLLEILLVVAKASEKSCRFIIKNMNSYLIAWYKVSSEAHFKLLILEYFVSLFETAEQWHNITNVNDDFKGVVEVLINETSSNNDHFKCSAFYSISLVTKLFTSNEAAILQDVLNYNINHEHSKIVVDASKKCLLALIKEYPSLYAQFVNELMILDSVASNGELLRRRLNIICSITSIDAYTDNILQKLLMHLSNSDMNMSLIILESINCAFMNEKLFTKQKFQDIEFKHHVIKGLFEWSVANKSTINKNVCECTTNLIILIMRYQDSNTQNIIFSELYSKLENMLLEDKSYYIIYLEALLNSCRNDMNFNNKESEIISQSFQVVLYNSDNDFMKDKACSVISNIFNKFINRSNVKEQYEKVKCDLSNIIDDPDNEFFSNAIMISSWLVKCFGHNGHSDATYWLTKLCKYINDDKWLPEIVKGFHLMMSEDDKHLNKKCHSKVNFLFRQKIFQLFLQCSSTMVSDEHKYKESYLHIWCLIVKFIPKSVILMELPMMTPLVLECLNLSNDEIISEALRILSYLIQQKKSVCGLQTLLPKCLHLSEKHNNVNVRVASLQCLYDIANTYSTTELLLYKQDTILELANQLDDRKRVVRNMAVKARTRWYLVGAPGEDKDH